ncbi:protein MICRORCHIDIA 1-like isoform X1 [Zingiber officinale]|uniref:protein MICRORCHIDIA 1-like isoform X1 n=2 Tax=Zingiber officinale TaxID=94328 RepID=UPI001C4D56BB|nr:protein MICRORCHIDIA 1-like isoform X1 [Zingiber officinale]
MPPTESPGDDMVVLGSPADGGVNRVRSLVAPEGDEAQKGRRVLECRNFWRAGAYEVRSGVSPSARHAAQESSDFDRARVHPKFLHTNATSHKWAFGAIAELLDNSVDEIQNGATFVKVDKVSNSKDNSPMLLFQDDGGGMDPEGIRRCMSLGFSTKRSKTTIGQYGNGFKTSTMRLGADAIVFSRANRGGNVTLCIGLLSYTFLRRTMKDDIIVPMLDFHIVNGQKTPIILSSQDEWDSSLKAILDWSPFSSMEELLLQFEDMGLHGTKVVVYNLWMNDDGLLELDFDDDDQDILLRDQAYSGGFTRANKEVVHCHVSSRLKYSLRAYASILYMRKFSNFHIILRGKPVEQVSIADELKFIKTITYKPQVGMDGESVSVRITIGFAKEAPVLGIFGVNVYHKNRLIMPYWKVVQEGSSRGRCVVGIFEANFIEPAHDKQDFERTPLFIRLESKLRQIILEYWKYNCHLIGYQSIDITTEKRKLKESEKHSDRHASKVQLKVPTPIGVACTDGSHLQPTGQTHAQSHDTMPISGEDDDDIEIIDVQDPSLIKKITEENIQLFMRREELQQTTNQLRRTVEELEHELAEVKKKCSQLAADLQIRGGKQHILGTNQS